MEQSSSSEADSPPLVKKVPPLMKSNGSWPIYNVPWNPVHKSHWVSSRFYFNIILSSISSILSGYSRQDFPTKILCACRIVIYDAIISTHVIGFYFVTIIFIEGVTLRSASCTVIFSVRLSPTRSKYSPQNFTVKCTRIFSKEQRYVRTVLNHAFLWHLPRVLW
jgi:hypothetical protein